MSDLVVIKTEEPPVHHAPQLMNSKVLSAALALRYQVYCVECNFLSPDDYPDGMESDEYDARSVHFYAFDTEDDLVGYVRLVKAETTRGFPFHDHCDLSLPGDMLPDAPQAAEISRLMVRSDYRRRRGDRLSGVTAQENQAAFAGDRRHQAPQILLSLYRQMYAYSLEQGIRFWYAAMERPLARSLQRFEFAFRPIGPQTDYYGPVAPYLADLRELECKVASRHPELMAWLRCPERRHGAASPAERWSYCRMSRPQIVVGATLAFC